MVLDKGPSACCCQRVARHIAELCAHTRQRKLFLFWGAELKRLLIVNYQKSYLGLSCNVRAGRKLNLSWRRQSYPHQRASRTVPF